MKTPTPITPSVCEIKIIVPCLYRVKLYELYNVRCDVMCGAGVRAQERDAGAETGHRGLGGYGGR